MRINIHIGLMVTIRTQKTPNIALLSVAGSGSEGIESAAGSARQDVAGGSLIEYQIATLARVGICKFLVEVENVDGSLIALAERCRDKKLELYFVRNGADLQRYIGAGDRIWVQSAQLYAQFGLVEMLSKATDNFVATVDGRDENAAFERIDLNTRWAGISVVDPDAIAMLRDLPDDWSIISSLLRQAVLAQIPFRLMSQQHVSNGTLTILSGAQDFSALNRQILRRRVASRFGFVESYLFGPIWARIVPVIWQSSGAIKITKCAAPVLASVAVVVGAGGFGTAACVVAFAAIAANSLRLAVTDDADDIQSIQNLSLMTWALIILAMFSAAYMQISYRDDGLFAAFGVSSLAFLTQKMALPDWAKKLLHSPAALTLLAASGAAVMGITAALEWIMVLQLSVLILVSIRNDMKRKKAKQA
jgi:hypothetical protein